MGDSLHICNWFIRKTIKITLEIKKKNGVEEYRKSKTGFQIVLQILPEVDYLLGWEDRGDKISLIYLDTVHSKKLIVSNKEAIKGIV